MPLLKSLIAAAAAGWLGTAAGAALAAGTLVVTYKDDVTTLDPAVGYDWQNWSMIKSVFSRLLDYEPGTTTLVPSLAERFEVAPDGLSYTFHLRPGVTFQNGRKLTAADVKYSIERAVDPRSQGPGSGFFAAIVGQAEMLAGTATEMPGIVAVDDATVRFTLSRPDATFLHVMAINFASVVPKEEVERYGPDFGKNPVGSGAFRLKEWKIGQELVFERNPDYFEPGLPKLDGFKVEVGQEPVVTILRLQQGEVDIAGDPIPPAKYNEVVTGAETKDLVVQGAQLQTGYVTLNVKIPPLDDVRVRRALAMAVNKDRIVRIINNRAVPANQPLPPLMPGYAKDYVGQRFDPVAAKALLAEAGLASGFATTLYVANTDPQPRIAQAIQQDLAAVGVKVELRSLAQANVIAAGGTEGEAPMVWSGGMAWIADFPDPSNFYGPILGCAGAVAGGWNWSWYCNPTLDAKAAKADTMADPVQATERAALWQEVFTSIQDEVPWIPIFNENRVVMHSARVTSPDAILVDPVHLVNYTHLEVKD